MVMRHNGQGVHRGSNFIIRVSIRQSAMCTTSVAYDRVILIKNAQRRPRSKPEPPLSTDLREMFTFPAHRP